MYHVSQDHVWIVRGSVLRNKLKTIIIIVAKFIVYMDEKESGSLEHMASEENLHVQRRLNI